MSTCVESTHRIAEVALGALKQIGLAAIPRNFELWYAHAEGRSPELSRAIQLAADANGKISQEAADELFKEHIQHVELSRDVIDLVSRFQAEISDLFDAIEETGENTSGHHRKLSDLSVQLRQTTEEYPAVGKLLEGVITVAQDMRAENEKLEHRLADSANEINTLQRNVESIQAEAMKDSLTGIANRSTFDKSLAQQIAEAVANDEPLSLVMADIDYFKKFNDKWGHQTGDQVLRLVAEVMNANVKGQDVLARYGGEEFAIVLPGTTLNHAHMLADRIRIAIETRRLKKRRTKEDLGAITMSMGVGAHREGDTSETIIERADECLYAAKARGRNLVVNEEGLKEDDESQRGSAA